MKPQIAGRLRLPATIRDFLTPGFPLSDVPLQEIARQVAARRLKAKPTRVFRFEEIREAHRVMEAMKLAERWSSSSTDRTCHFLKTARWLLSVALGRMDRVGRKSFSLSANKDCRSCRAAGLREAACGRW
jgi:hypothetical protein